MKNAKHARPKEQKEKKENRRSGKGFKWFLLVWILLFAAFGAYAMKYVNDTLKEMQANSLKQFISDAVVAMGDDEIDKYFEFNREIEAGNASPEETVREYFRGQSFKVKQVPRTDTYNVYNELDQLILSAEIIKKENVSKIGIFNYNILEMKGLAAAENKELLHTEITAPTGYYVKVNGTIRTPDRTTYPEGFKDAGNFVELPGESVYVLDHLTQWPQLEIYDERAKYDVALSDKIYLANDYEEYLKPESAGCDMDVIGFVKNWMLFMQNDLSGSQRGFGTLKQFFIEGSDQYQKAYAWATNVDITFVSDHTLKNPAFTDEAVTKVVKYNDDAISVDVYMRMHMRLKTGVDRNPTFNSTLYLVRYEGTWRVVNIRSNEKQAGQQQ